MQNNLISFSASDLLGGAQAQPGERHSGARKALFDALLHQESGGKQTNSDGSVVTSAKGAIGIAQVMPGTAPEAAALAGLPFDEAKYHTDADYNAALGRAYLDKQLLDFGNDEAKALAAYNAGPGAVRRAIRRAEGAGQPDQWLTFLPTETQNYVPKILSRAGAEPVPTESVPPASTGAARPVQIKPRSDASAFDFAKELAASGIESIGSIGQFFGEAAAALANKLTKTEDYEGKNLLAPISQGIRNSMTEGGKQAREEGSVQGDIFDLASVELPQTARGWAMLTAQGLGSLASTLIPIVGPSARTAALARAAEAAKAAGDLAKAAKLAQQAKSAAGLSRTVGVASGGATTAGSAAGEVRANLDRAFIEMGHDRLMAEVPAYADVYNQTGDEAQARRAVINDAALAAGVLSGVFGAVGGAFNVKLLEDFLLKQGLARVAGQSTGSMVGRAAISGGVGSLAEGGQETAEKVGQNIGENIGKGRPALEGATRDTAGDAIGGLVVGGGVGAGFGAGARASSGGGESGASGPAGGAPGAAQPSQEPAQNAPIKADTQGPVEAAAARPNSPLSRAAVSGSAGQQHAVDARAARLAELDAKASGTPESTVTDDAGVRRRIPGQQPQFLTDSERAEREQLRDRTATQEEPRRQGAQQSLDERLQAAREAASEAGTLDALRSPGAPIDAKSFVRDLSVASSPSTSAHLREQAMTRVEMALGWAAQNRVGQPATSMSEVAGDYGRGVPEGERPSAPQLRDAVDRESALHEQLARASTEFERQQIRAQMGVNREMRMRAQPEPEPTTQEREPGIAPSEQAALEAAGLAGTVSRRRDEDEPRQVVINRAMRSIEERGGVASPAEAQIVFEAGLGRPYDRIDESLAPPAGPVVPRMSDSQAPSGIQVEQSNSRRDQGRLEGAQSSAELTPSQWPTATTSLGARAEREPGINPSPDDFGADRFSPQADGPGVSASAGRVPAMRMEPAHAEGAQSRVPALLRKRRETLAQLVDMGFTTVEHNADGFVLSNPATGATFALDGSVDAQLARAAVSSYVDDAAARADVSPTDAQKEAGNYRKGTPIQLNGVTVIIENPRNSVRKGVDEDGNHWESKLSHHYGYISRSTGADGDQVDVFIGPRPDSARIYVVDQLSPDGSFDEHKVLFGFTSEQGARAGYLKNYSAGWNGLGAITEMTQPEFKAWLKNESQRKPVSTNLDGALNARPNQQPVDRGGAGGRPAGGAAVLADGPRTGRADARGAGLVDRAPEPATRGAAVERVAAPDVRLGEDRLGEPVAPNRRRLTIQDRGQARTVTLLDDPTASGELSAEHVGVLRSIAEALGLRAEFFAADRAIGDGFVDDRFPGRIFLSTNPSINPIEVLGHELWHQLKRGGPRGAAAAAAIESALIDRGVDLSGFARYYDRSTNVAGRESVYLEELSADLFGTHFSDPSFWSEVFAAINDKHAQRESRGIIAELAARLLGVVDRALSLFRQGGFQSSRYVPQAQALRAAFRDALVGYIQDQEARPTAMKAELMRAVTRMNRSTERGGGAAGGQVDERALGVGAVAATLAAGNLDASVPHYGVPQRGSVSASAVHYSNDNRAHLDSAAYGRGLKGAERIRLEGVENADIRPRIFFYVDKGNGIRPEAGVGAYPHAVRLDNLYDIWSDPLDLRKNNPGANNWERAIMLAGFDGYLSLDPLLPQGFAILVGARHSAVPVSPTRVPTAAAVSAPAPTTVRRSLLSRELDAVDVSAIPGARMVSGSLVVPHSSIGEANLEMERIGSEVRFSAAREASEEETTSVRKYRLDIAREARSKVRRGNLSNEERNAIIADGEEMRLQKRQIRELIKKAREFKRRYPASAGWAPLTAAGITGDIDLETGSIAPGTERVKYKAIAYAFNTPPGKKRAPARIDQEWLGKVSSEFEKMILDVFDRAEKGDENAKTILSHQTWYRGVTESLRREYGGFGDLLADLLGATSPNTPVETNWNFSIDAMRRFLSGQFDSELTRLEQWIEAGNPVSSFADADKIRQASGKLYGINSGNAMLAMLDMWRIIRPGTAPKARNFALNLIGQSNMATIDVWAARMLRRAANAVKGASFPRIPPEAEVGVSGVWNASGDAVTGAFGFGASVMDRASESLKRKGLDISPPDLQAIAWFAEKELWATKGWTTIVGESGSFEEMIEQRPRDRYMAGWTIQQSEPPSDAEMSAAQKRVVDVLSSDPSVIASRVAPTIGLYGSYEERSFDTEWVADREEHDPTKAIREIAKIASENNQFDIFVSRVLRPEEQSPNARPGVEVYFRNQKSMEEARPILEAFTKRGQDGFTLTVDPRQRRDGYIGVRLQYVPEITARFDPVAARRRLLIPGGIERTLAGKTRAMDRIVAELSDLHGVAFAAVWQYDTVVFGRENYDEAIDRGTARADRQTGARVRLGESVRAELERAVARYAGERQQADAGRLHGADHAAQGGAQPQEGVAEGGDSWWGSDARLSRSRAEPPEGEYATRAELAVVRRQKLGAAGPIKDLGDAANALHYLSRSAVERVDVLVTSARGKPLAIIGGFKGELASSPVMPVTLLAEAVQVPGAANLWVVHNHPSGATDLSEADRALAITLSSQFDGTGIAVRGMIAVSKSGWGGVWVEGSRLSAIGEQAGRIAPVEGKTVPALERQLSSDGKLIDAPIYTVQAAREAALAAAGVYNSPVIIMLDMRHRALAVVPWSGKDAAQLKNNGKLDALLRAVSTANAGRAIIALGDGMTKDQARNLATGLQRAGVTTLDIVDKSGNSSASVGEGLYADVLRSAHRYANSPEFQRWFEGSKVVDKSGRPLIVYHGTTHDISAFDVSVANVESDWGAGIYFTTSPVDASQNYAGLGPDLLSRVERLADTIAHERQITPEAALGVALTQLSGGAPNIIPAYLSMRNPFIVGGPGQTFLGHEYDPENEDAAPSGDLQRIIDAIYEVPDDIIDFDPDALVAEISQAALDDGGLTAEDLDAVLRASSAINESSDPATGDYLAAEVERMILEYAGFDGVIDRTVSNKFGESSGRAKPMAGVDHNTVHYVIFDPTQAKSAIGNLGTFSREDRDIARSTTRGWYSQLQRAIAQAPERLATMAAPQWAQWIKANASKLGVKQDEITWSGIEDYLKLRGKDKITRKELSDWVGQNGVWVAETMLRGGYGPNYTANEWQQAIDRAEADGDFEEAERLQTEWEESEEDDTPGNARYSTYVIPGGQNYREILLTLPKSSEVLAIEQRLRDIHEELQSLFANSPRASEFLVDVPELLKERSRLGEERERALEDVYSSPHWNEPDVIAHVRVDDRTDSDGKRVLFVNELQSDWGQEGRKSGFRDERWQRDFERVRRASAAAEEEVALAQARHEDALDHYHGAVDKYEAAAEDAPADQRDSDPGLLALSQEVRTAALRSKLSERSLAAALNKRGSLLDEVRSFRDSKNHKLPRQAPFVVDTESWLMLALKRVIKSAVYGRYDRVAFVTGDQAAGLYDLSKHVDAIDYRKSVDDGEDSYYLRFIKDDLPVQVTTVETDRLADTVGKELAARMIAGEGEPQKAVRGGQPMTRLSGLDLQVGGRGMRAFYDEIVPQAAAKLLKKLGGGQIHEITIPLLREGWDDYSITEANDEGFIARVGRERERFPTWAEANNWLKTRLASKQPAFDITPKMSASVEAGVPMFSRVRDDARRTTPRIQGLPSNYAYTARERAEAQGFDTSKTWYHGTTAGDIKRFRKGKGGIDELGPGIYFTSHPMYAEAWAGRPGMGGSVIPVWLKRGDHFDVGAFRRRPATTEAERLAKVMPIIERLRSHPDAKAVQARMTTPQDDLWKTWLAPGVDDGLFARHILGGALNTWLERAGYIGVIDPDSQVADQIAVLRPEYIKSIYNKGPFDPSDGRISRSADRAFDAPEASRFDDLFGGFAGADDTVDRLVVTSSRGDTKLVKLGNINSEGRQIAGTTQGLEAFWRWFGDSETVDGSGRPLVLFHGTAADVSRFETMRATKNTGLFGAEYDARRAGIFFTQDKAVANEFAERQGGNVMPVYVRMERPADLRRGLSETLERELTDAGYNVRAMDAVQYSWELFDEEHGGPDLVAALKKAGYDGAIIRDLSPNEEQRDFVSYVAFDATQIKSAIGNRGTFSPNDADVTRSAARARFDTPETSRFDDLVYKLQDKHIDTKRVVDAVRAVDADLREDLDVYLQEELFHGRVAKRTEDFVHHELQPLVDAMRAKGLTVADLDEYLHARHAREANEVIAQRDPEIQDGGSGMLNQDAEAYFAGLPQDKRRALEEVSIQVDAMLRKTRDLLVSYELESRAKVQGWADMFEHYVPLMREDEGGHTGTGQGFSIRGKEVKSRTGSTRRVVDILANIAMQRERTIVRGEKNRVSQALFGLAALSPNEAFWDVDTHVPTEPVFNPATGLVEDRPDTMYKLRPNVVVAKFAGEGGTVSERAVVFNEKNERALRMAEALKNLDTAQLEGLLGASAKLTRYFASINTQYNPVFGVVNLVRDVQEAMVNLGSTELAGKRATIARATPRALAGIYSARRAERSGERSSSDWARLWDEFQRVGGQTGYRQLFVTSTDRADAIRATLDPNAWMDSKLGRVFTVGGALKAPLGAAQRAAKWIFDWLSDYNEAMENGVRLAAYRVGLDAGLSKERAASVAKNLTVNFNRRGQAGQQAGALYAFFNASMQGTARVARTLFDMDPGKPKTIRLSKTGKKVVYGGMLLGSIQAFALAAAGFGDDDPPEWARQRNLIIPLGGKKYISIPLPLGLLVIPSIGRSATEWALGGFKDTSKRVEDMVSMFADAFNPIGNAGLSMQTLAPTALDPLVALTENRDWTGRPIARTSSNKAIPGHALARDTSTEAAQILSEAINTLSGGTRYTAGILSPTPDQIDYLAGQVGGGVWRELSKAEQTVRSAITGESLPPYKVPLLGRLFGSAKSQASEGNSFYANVERLNRIETELKGLRRDGNTREAAELRSRLPEAYLITQANYAERKVQKLRAKKRELLRAGAPRERVKEIEDQITSTMASLNRAVEALQAH